MNKIQMNQTLQQHQRGAALVVGLLLLVVITVLAISGMNTATTELAMARNDQAYEDAFQLAERGLADALSRGNFNTAGMAATTQFVSSGESYTAGIQFEDSTLVPDMAFSLGVGTGISAYHFLATSQAEMRRDPGNTTDRDSTAIHTQAFYIVGPELSAL
ncbi:MAG TPA: PilX N-terminal domain-containing pilus assembly protein [Woeseiaceae bacterium]|jgi:type IV pilus assembly protein PilX|nr:PilX N-terminal domain-containing pilus assembly protein [Woeseiaceae bacterium]